MKLFAIECENFMADGGTMFGVVPKAIWSKRYNNNDNLCNNAIRNLLIDDGERRILIDTAIGTRISSDFLKHQYLNGNYDLISSLSNYGYSVNDITDIIFTHLHWDHCGGAFVNDIDGKPISQFPNANFWVSKKQLEWALTPNIREKAAYPDYLIYPLRDMKKLKMIDSDIELFPNIEVRIHDGHTAGMLTPIINCNGGKIVFVGDLMPVSVNISPIYISAYDIFPLDAINAKLTILREIIDNNYYIMFQHDINVELCTITETDRGYKIDKTLKLTDLDVNT